MQGFSFGSHDKHLYAVDAETGQEQWRFKTEGVVDGTPVGLLPLRMFESGSDATIASEPK